MIYLSHDKSTQTRRILYAAVFGLMLMPAAHAADWPGEAPLRGSVQPAGSGVRWDGVNFGGQVGAGGMNTDFGSSGSKHVAYDFRNTIVGSEMHPETWTTLSSANTNGRTFGGFVGYSVQWDDVVLGVDAAYNKVLSGFDQNASDYIGRQNATSDGFTNQVGITSGAQVRIKDYATFRGRAGYAFGQFLPYAFAGVAVARVDYATTTRVQASGQPPTGSALSNYNTDNTYRDSKNDAFTAGFTTGLGLDVALLPNVFLRAEWEYIAFSQINGIRNTLNTGRVGVGMRF